MAALPGPWQGWLDETLLSLEARQVLRRLHTLVATQHAVQAAVMPETLAEWAGLGLGEARQLATRRLTLFATNDYLGLSTHADVRAAAAHAALLAGSGPRSSPLVGGHTTAHAALEAELAELKGTEAALLFPSGFAANTAALSALCGSPSTPRGTPPALSALRDGPPSPRGTAPAPSALHGSRNPSGEAASGSSGSRGVGTGLRTPGGIGPGVAGGAATAGAAEGGGPRPGPGLRPGGRGGLGAGAGVDPGWEWGAAPGPAPGTAPAAIFSDELNHASIVDGARLAARAGARLHIFRHKDLQHLDALLAACPAHARKLIVSDALFSMDGDYADLEGLLALKRKHAALLLLDEAHTSLVGWGPLGDDYDSARGPDIVVGTLSKALGSQGGFVACSARVRSLLLSRGRPLIFSTALPLPAVEAARAALRVAQQEPWRRRHLWGLVARLGQRLGVPALSPIVPLIFGEEGLALEASRALLRRGFYVPAIRPPTVPQGTSRLRISLSAAHTEKDVDALVEAIRECCSLSVPRAAEPGHGSLQATAKL